MPPWLPAPSGTPFIGERRLTTAEITTLKRWADSGAPQGDPVQPSSVLPAVSEWTTGVPDLVLKPARAFTLEAGGGDVFRNLVIRAAIPADRFVRTVEFRTGGAPVHHAVVHLDPTQSSRERDGRDGKPGFDGMGAPGTQDPDGHFVGWAPGRGPIHAAEGRPWKLAKGADLVIELHLIPQAQPVAVQPSVALFFAEGTTGTPPIMLKLGSSAIDIAPGVTDYAIADRYTLPVDATVLSLYPHAHFLGKDMQVQASLPDGRSLTLLHIPRWSFHWQQDYRYVTPVTLPRGTVVSMRFTYDNSDANPDNPHHPPVRVRAGQRSTDEMGNLLLQLQFSSVADRARLELDVRVREAAANPGSWTAHHDLGGAYFKAGQLAEAVSHLREAARLQPGEATVQFNLGKALAATGAAAAAKAAFQRTIVLRPDFAEAHNELGVLLFAQGRLQEALRYLRKAVDLNPASAVAQSDLGGALAQAGRVSEAVTHLRQALAIDPASAAARENLARLLKGR